MILGGLWGIVGGQILIVVALLRVWRASTVGRVTVNIGIFTLLIVELFIFTYWLLLIKVVILSAQMVRGRIHTIIDHTIHQVFLMGHPFCLSPEALFKNIVLGDI